MTLAWLELAQADTKNQYTTRKEKAISQFSSTYVARKEPYGAENKAQRCERCGKTFYVKFGAQWYRCPWCDSRQKSW